MLHEALKGIMFQKNSQIMNFNFFQKGKIETKFEDISCKEVMTYYITIKNKSSNPEWTESAFPITLKRLVRASALYFEWIVFTLKISVEET